jgi:hypothetical protein
MCNKTIENYCNSHKVKKKLDSTTKLNKKKGEEEEEKREIAVEIKIKSN